MYREVNFYSFKIHCIATVFVLSWFDLGKANEILLPLERQLWSKDGRKVVKCGSASPVTYKIILGVFAPDTYTIFFFSFYV